MGLFGRIIVAGVAAANRAAKAEERQRAQAQRAALRMQQAERRDRLRRLVKEQAFMVAFPRRKQILEESVGTIATSVNLKTIVGRYDTVLTQYEWMMKQKRQGMPFSFSEEACGFEDSTRRMFNENVERIVAFVYEKDIAGIVKTKNAESRQKKIEKLRKTISHALASLKVHQNKIEIADRIRKHRDAIKETLKEIGK